ncbi:hypothetical protein ElyMa_003563000 [Elysia marginata]|uniref:Uncharacterized protein n=1 Tax=Elysia marginata TaxID=1093978 RepID=A0AAV4EKQ3_9GAST|nr:hypothetical protein ElyMa_003563000 [Elysia marginata]
MGSLDEERIILTVGATPARDAVQIATHAVADDLAARAPRWADVITLEVIVPIAPGALIIAEEAPTTAKETCGIDRDTPHAATHRGKGITNVATPPTETCRDAVMLIFRRSPSPATVARSGRGTRPPPGFEAVDTTRLAVRPTSGPGITVYVSSSSPNPLTVMPTPMSIPTCPSNTPMLEVQDSVVEEIDNLLAEEAPGPTMDEEAMETSPRSPLSRP